MAVYSTLSSQQFSQSCLLYFRLAGKALAAGHKQQESNSDHQAPYYSNPFGSTKSSIAACRQNYLSTGILCTHTYIYIYIVLSINIYIYIYICVCVCCIYIYIYYEWRTKFLITRNGHGQSGWSPIGCEGLYFHSMCENTGIGKWVVFYRL